MNSDVDPVRDVYVQQIYGKTEIILGENLEWCIDTLKDHSLWYQFISGKYNKPKILNTS